MIIRYTKMFILDYKRQKRKHGFDVTVLNEKLQKVLENLEMRRVLMPEFKEQLLHSKWKDFKSCYISNDLLLIYKISDNELELVRLGGNHSDLGY